MYIKDYVQTYIIASTHVPLGFWMLYFPVKCALISTEETLVQHRRTTPLVGCLPERDKYSKCKRLKDLLNVMLLSYGLISVFLFCFNAFFKWALSIFFLIRCDCFKGKG